MLAPVAALAALATVVTAYHSQSILQQGEPNLKPNLWSKWRIPAKQQSGEIIFPKHFACSVAGGVTPPRMLRVEVLDQKNVVKIRFSPELREGYVYRATDDDALHGDALVLLSANCDLPPPVPPLDPREGGDLPPPSLMPAPPLLE